MARVAPEGRVVAPEVALVVPPGMPLPALWAEAVPWEAPQARLLTPPPAALCPRIPPAPAQPADLL